MAEIKKPKENLGKVYNIKTMKVSASMQAMGRERRNTKQDWASKVKSTKGAHKKQSEFI